jgi:hypothetical protein
MLAVAPWSHGQLLADQFITRTFKLPSNNPLGAVTASELHERFANLGIMFPSDPEAAAEGRAMFLNERTGALTVRTTIAEMDKVEALVTAFGTPATPPIVQLEAKFIELRSLSVLAPLRPQPPAFTSVTIYTEQQSRAALKTFDESAGVNVITAPSVTTISGRQARLRIEESRTLQYDTPPRYPRDTRPDADPTPYNKGRLPFPPTFARR